MDPAWLPETGSTSAFADAIVGDYEINKMIQQPLDMYKFLLDSPPATPNSKLKRKAPDANRDQERKKEFCCFKSHMQTSAFDDEIGGGYEINKMIPPLDMFKFLLDSPPATPDSKLKTKAPNANRDQERKKEVDRAYRQRCKEKKNKNEENLKGLTEENNKLKRENGHIKQEEERLREVVRTQNGFMKQLQDRFSQLKTQLDKQITLVDVLSKELAKCKDIDRQREVDRLKHETSLLHKKTNNRDSVNIIQLEAKITKLEQEKRSLQMIIDALCMKINQDSAHGIKEASPGYINNVDECWKL
ncbi:rho-associated protein [Salix suchowensis]|nr:rho-associated protein [Salix suchowensis]